MSPVGGVGINLAIQDAVAAANILWKPLRERRVADDDLAAVQRRRLLPTRVVQRMQVLVQRRIISAVLGATTVRAPQLLRLLGRCPRLQRIPRASSASARGPNISAAPNCGQASRSAMPALKIDI